MAEGGSPQKHDGSSDRDEGPALPVSLDGQPTDAAPALRLLRLDAEQREGLPTQRLIDSFRERGFVIELEDDGGGDLIDPGSHSCSDADRAVLQRRRDAILYALRREADGGRLADPAA